MNLPCMYVYIYIMVYLFHINDYIYIYIGRTCLVAPMLLLIRMRSVCIQLNTNVIRGACETCTTSVTRAQLLPHVHNFCETCTTSLKRAHIEDLKTLGGGGETRYTHIYILYYILYIIYIYYIIYR